MQVALFARPSSCVPQPQRKSGDNSQGRYLGTLAQYRRSPSTTVDVRGVSASAGRITSVGLVFTGAAVIGIGALGALFPIGGAIMVIAVRRRKANA